MTTREKCVIQVVDFSISGERVSRVLGELANTRGLPAQIVSDKGPEFTSKAMFLWAQQSGVKLHFIQPAKPTQNALVESYNGKFRGVSERALVRHDRRRQTPHRNLAHSLQHCSSAQQP